MVEIGTEQQLCPCFTEKPEFHKLVELKNSGLVVYCHSWTRPKDGKQGEVVENAVNTSEDVYILHNTKNEKIIPADLTPELEKEDVHCPRCKKKIEHAQELMRKVSSIKRNYVIGVCNHCRKKAQATKKRVCECEKIVKIWLLKMKCLPKDGIDKPKKRGTCSCSDLQTNRLLQNSPPCRHDPNIQQMYDPDTNKSYTNDTEIYDDERKDRMKQNLTSESKLTGKISKDLKASEQKSKQKNVPKDKLSKETERSKNDVKAKHEQRGAVDKGLEKDKKGLKSKPEHTDKEGKEKESKGKALQKEKPSSITKETKEDSTKKAKDTTNEDEFKKMLAENRKQKEQALEMKNQQETEARIAKELADKRAQETELNLKSKKRIKQSSRMPG